MCAWEIVSEKPSKKWEIVEDDYAEPERNINPYENEMQKNAPETSFFDKLYSGGMGLKQGVESLPYGVMQLMGVFPETVKRRMEENQKEYDVAKERNPWSFGAGNVAGHIGKTLPFAGLGGMGLSSLGRAGIPTLGLSGNGVLGNIGAGALGGGITGGLDYVNPGEDRATNALFGATAGGLIPGGLGVGKGAFKAVKNLNTASKPIGKHVQNFFKTAENQQNKYSKLYSDLFNKAEKGEKTLIERPIFKQRNLTKTFEKAETEATRKFLKSPTIANAQEAQSELGRLNRKLSKAKGIRELSGGEKKALTSAKTAQQQIKKSIENALPDEKAVQQYRNITSGYKKEVVPYKHRIVEDYKAGKLTDEDFVKKILGNTVTRKQLLPFHPEFGIHKGIRGEGKNALGLLTKGALTGLGAGGAGVPAAYYLYKALNEK